MAHVVDEPIAFLRLESAIKNTQMFAQQIRSTFDGVMFLDVLQNVLNLFFGITQALQGGSYRIVYQLDLAAANQLFVLDQGNVRLDTGGIAIHHEADGAGRGNDRDLRILKAVALSHFQRIGPNFLCSRK